MASDVTLSPLGGIKLVEPGDDLGAITVAALRENGLVPRQGDVLVVAQKIVSKAEGRYVDIATVRPSEERVLLLPLDPDGSAQALRQYLLDVFGVGLGVIISDSFGRAWRKGTVGVALGAAGLPALVDRRGHPDLFGRELLVTETGFADEIAAAAGLLMGQADEAVPMVLVRGLTWSAPDQPGAALIRPAEHDLFR